MSEIYFDNAATTAVSEKAAKAAYEVMTDFYGNPSSAHAKGLEAEHILKRARSCVMSCLGYTPKDGTLLFTSCGTEANNTVFFGAYEVFGKRKSNIVISDSEHPSIENCARELEKKGVEVRRIPTTNGKLDLDFAEKAIDSKTMLISCMLVNNETGAVYDIKSLDGIRKRNAPDAYLHTDAVQGFCKIPYSLSALGADLVSISGHKIHAPKGVGALYIKKGIRIPTRMFGGGQEGGLRSGTENLAGIAAFGAAAEEYMNEKTARLNTIKELNTALRKNLSEICPYVLINSGDDFANHILSISVPGIRSEIMLRFLSEKGIFVSAGSACSSKNADNRVLSNFGLSDKTADSTLRISFSKYNTKEETLILANAIDEGNTSLIHTVWFWRQHMKIKNLCEILTEEFAKKVLSDSANPTPVSCDGFNGDISGVAFDSREVKEGYLFVAIKGVKTDGHIYIPKAVELGAAAVICEDADEYRKYEEQYKNVSFFLVKNARRALAIVSKHFYGNVSDKMTIIGLTGTKGKTSTSFMISKILNEAGKRCGIIGTTGAYFENFYLEMNHSTPESRDLHALFEKMYSLGATHVVMEVSSQALMMYRVYGIEFEVGIFTNISPDHIGEGEHTDFDDYLYCKSKLFTMCKKAVVNADSDKAQYILDVCKVNEAEVVTFGCESEWADYRATGERFYIDGGMKTHFDIVAKDNKYPIEVSVPGKFSVFNALCAASCALTLGIDFATIAKALTNVKVIGRIEPVENPKLKAPVIIDYAHNAMSLESLFTAVKAYNPKRIICVFGCGGNRSKLRRYEMGEISGKYADLSIITADNSRFEELDDIIADILIGMGKTDGKYEIIKDRKDAIYRAIELSQQGDIILLAGKGQETYLDVKGVKTHFDEREVVNSYFER